MADVTCPSCSRPIALDHAWCPWCGERVLICCERCFTSLRPGWSWCPHCGQKARQEYQLLQAGHSGSEAERHNQAGIALYDQEQYPAAIEEFMKAIALEPDNGLYHSNLAVAYQEANQPELALAEYQKAVEIDPGDTTALLNLGHLYASLGQEEEAAERWRQVMEKDADGPDGDEARRSLLASKANGEGKW